GKVQTPYYFLLIAGLIMVITLWTSKKAKSVIKTSLDLGRQEEGYERFESTAVSRAIVRGSSNLSKFMVNVIPKSVQDSLDKQFDQTAFHEKQKALGVDAPAFDMIRASVTLVVASILIAIGTSLKLPLSTTYVTFMVAMGTSLSDRAWGTESAVYRVTGVISVIGGWFFTAFSAFTGAFIMALLFSYFGFIAVFAMLSLAAFMMYRTHFLHKKRVAVHNADEDEDEDENESINTEKIVKKTSKTVIKTLDKIGEYLSNSILYFGKEDLKKLRTAYTDFEKVNLKTKSIKDNLSKTIDKLEDSAVESGHFYVQVAGYLREISHSAFHIIQPVFKHLDNSHRAFLPEQIEEIMAVQEKISDLISKASTGFRDQDFSTIDAIIEEQHKTLDLIKSTRKLQVKRIKNEDLGTRNSMLFFNILEEYKNIILYMINMLKSQRDFINFVDGNGENPSEEI
ncbi:MAG: phosphate permease, partial [Bacteroidetes bacterium]